MSRPQSIIHAKTTSIRNDATINPSSASWIVNDTKAPLYLPFYPQPSKHTSCILQDLPSTIASRVSKCLISRSVDAEYDEEAVKATCLTVDRCCFVVNLWYYDAPSNNDEALNNTAHASSKRMTLVECVRRRGSGFTFHRNVRAILRAAQGLESNQHEPRTLEKSGPLGFSRFVSHQEDELEQIDANSYGSILKARPSLLQTNAHEQIPIIPSITIRDKVQNAVENVLVLLRKDRLVPQIAGMEQLVSLTDPVSVGLDTAIYVAKCILGHSFDICDDSGDSSDRYPQTLDETENIFHEIREKWILELLIQRRLPTERRSPSNDIEDHSEALLLGIDEDHVGKMRSMVLRIISNSLSSLSRCGNVSLKEILTVHSQVWTSENFMEALIDDVKNGTDRQVHEVYGTRLASKHDAAIACRIIGRLVQHNKGLKQRLQMSSVSKHFEHALNVSDSAHIILAKEAEKTFQLLTCYDNNWSSNC